jgi:uncharacterized protein YdaU (DUF1376 family)
MKPAVWMPCMVKDLLADTLHLDNSQFGSYWLLICAYWMRRGPLSDDDQQLRQISRCKETEWVRTKGVLAQFFDTSNGLWTHEKVDSLLAEAIENMRLQQARTEAARAVALAHKQPKKSVTGSVTRSVTESSAPSPSPSPSDPTTTATDRSAPDGAARAKSVSVKFVKPSLEEMKLNGAKIGLPESECEACFNFYESNGWRVGRNPMKSWPGAMGTWFNNWRNGTYAGRNKNNSATHPINPRNIGICGDAPDYAAASKRKQLLPATPQPHAGVAGKLDNQANGNAKVSP